MPFEDRNLISFDTSSSNSSLHERGDNTDARAKRNSFSSISSSSSVEKDQHSNKMAQSEENDDFFDLNPNETDVESLLSFSSKKKPFEQRSLSLDFEIAERPEEGLKDGNIECNNSCADSKNPQASATSMQEYDKRLLSESDNLLQDVVKLCDDIGIESQDIQELKQQQKASIQQQQHENEHSSNSRDNKNESFDQNETMGTTIGKKGAGFDESENEGTLNLSSISCPSAVLNQSGASTSRTIVEASNEGKKFRI